MADENEKVQLNVQVETTLRDELQKWADAETEGNVSLLVRKILRQEVARRNQTPFLPTVDSGKKAENVPPTAKPTTAKRSTASSPVAA